MIPFRTQRLATSVVNRILDIDAGLPPITAAPGIVAAPEPLQTGEDLDAKLAQPSAPVDADPQTAQDIALAAGGLV